MRKITYELNMSSEDYFNDKFNNNNNENIINFVAFTKFVTKEFNIPPPVSRAMYNDLQNVNFSHKITKGDLIDMINRQIEYNRDLNNKKKKNDDEDDNNINYMNSIKKNSDFNSISLLDKKYYENEMKNFVKCLQKGFITKNTQEIKDEFINNIKSFYNLPETMKLNQFRELFIKPTAMDYSLGISTFQVCRTYLKKSNNDINILEKIQMYMS